MADLATTKPKDIVDLVAGKVAKFTRDGELVLPPDYSAANALKQAYLVLQDVKDKNGKPALEVSTTESVANALLNMVVMGLSPAKNQGYFIVYGTCLTFQRSYFGSMALAMRADDSIEDIFADVIYADDEFEYELVRGNKKILRHVQKVENIDKATIKGAYCVVVYKDGREKTTVMTFPEIKEAWKMSKVKPVLDNGNLKADSTHAKFTAEMCKRTVINRACKPIINASDDSYLMMQAIRETEADIIEAEATEIISENANSGEVVPKLPEAQVEVEEQEQPRLDIEGEGPGF